MSVNCPNGCDSEVKHTPASDRPYCQACGTILTVTNVHLYAHSRRGDDNE